MTLCILSRVAMAEQERHDFVRSIRHSLLDLARRIEHASSTKEVEYVIARLRQISRDLLRLEEAEGLTEEVRNSLVTVSSMLSEVEQQQQQQCRQNIFFYLNSSDKQIPLTDEFTSNEGLGN